MRKVDTAAVVAFKTKVEGLSAFFASKGYPVQHMHLMEGLSQYEGARDWRTYRAQLNAGKNEFTPALRVSLDDFRNGEFDMGSAKVTVYLSAYASEEGGFPDVMKVTVDQKWVESLCAYQETSQRQMESIDETSLAPEWVENKWDWSMRNSRIKVHFDVMTFIGEDEDGVVVDSGEFPIENFIDSVGTAVAEGKTEAFLISDMHDFQGVLLMLKRQADRAEEEAAQTKQTVTVYFDAHSCQPGKYSPDFCSMDFDEGVIGRMLGLRDKHAKRTKDVHEGDFAPDWVDNNEPWNIHDDGLTFSGDSFWFYATQDGGRIESPVYDFDEVVKKARAALANNTPEVFLLESPSAIGKLMAQLERKPGDPLYVGTPLTEQERYALKSCLTYWGDLSYAEVLAILDGESSQPRDSFDAKDEMAIEDDETIAEEIRQAYDDFPSYMTP